MSNKHRYNYLVNYIDNYCWRLLFKEAGENKNEETIIFMIEYVYLILSDIKKNLKELKIETDKVSIFTRDPGKIEQIMKIIKTYITYLNSFQAKETIMQKYLTLEKSIKENKKEKIETTMKELNEYIEYMLKSENLDYEIKSDKMEIEIVINTGKNGNKIGIVMYEKKEKNTNSSINIYSNMNEEQIETFGKLESEDIDRIIKINEKRINKNLSNENNNNVDYSIVKRIMDEIVELNEEIIQLKKENKKLKKKSKNKEIEEIIKENTNLRKIKEKNAKEIEEVKQENKEMYKKLKKQNEIIMQMRMNKYEEYKKEIQEKYTYIKEIKINTMNGKQIEIYKMKENLMKEMKEDEIEIPKIIFEESGEKYDIKIEKIKKERLMKEKEIILKGSKLNSEIMELKIIINDNDDYIEEEDEYTKMQHEEQNKKDEEEIERYHKTEYDETINKELIEDEIKIYEISLEKLLIGGNCEIQIDGEKYSIDVAFIREGTVFKIPNKNLKIKMIYEKHSNYRREGNNLIGEFTYSRQHEGKPIPIPFILSNKLNLNIEIQEGIFEIENYGFIINKETNERGKYILIIHLK